MFSSHFTMSCGQRHLQSFFVLSFQDHCDMNIYEGDSVSLQTKSLFIVQQDRDIVFWQRKAPLWTTQDPYTLLV